MATNSKIEWTEATWNPVAGCTILSPGCANCYAMRMAARLAVMGQEKYVGTTRKSGGRAKWNGIVKIDPSSLDIPRRWKKGRLIFVNSMSDLFHDSVPLAFIRKVFQVMEETPQHTYQVLTKRAERLEALSKKLPWPTNVWMGVSVESSDYEFRIDHLRRTKAKTRFLSLEPLLGPLHNLDLRGIHWAIAGGESGPGARPMPKDWVRSIRDQCKEAEVAFHFKQWGGKNKKRTGRMLDGRTWDEWPNTKLRVSRPQLRYELTRVKDNAEIIAMTGGDNDERERLDEKRQLALLENGSASDRAAQTATKRGPKKGGAKIKYRDLRSGETWSGRGRMARWLADKVKAGENRDKYLA